MNIVLLLSLNFVFSTIQNYNTYVIFDKNKNIKLNGKGCCAKSIDKNFCVHTLRNNKTGDVNRSKNENIIANVVMSKENEILLAKKDTTIYDCDQKHDHQKKTLTDIVYIIYEHPAYTEKFGTSFDLNNLLSCFSYKTQEDKFMMYDIFKDFLGSESKERSIKIEYSSFFYDGHKYWTWTECK